MLPLHMAPGLDPALSPGPQEEGSVALDARASTKLMSDETGAPGPRPAAGKHKLRLGGGLGNTGPRAVGLDGWAPMKAFGVVTASSASTGCEAPCPLASREARMRCVCSARSCFRRAARRPAPATSAGACMMAEFGWQLNKTYECMT